MTVFCENKRCKFCSKRRMRIKNGIGEEMLVHTCAKKYLTLSKLTETDVGYDDTETLTEPNWFSCLSFEDKEEVNHERDKI